MLKRSPSASPGMGAAAARTAIIAKAADVITIRETLLIDRKVNPNRWLSSRFCHHFKFEMQSRNLVTRMILGVSQLRLPVKQLRLGGRSLIDARKQVDQVLARSARCGEVNNDVAVTVEPAHVSHVRVF